MLSRTFGVLFVSSFCLALSAGSGFALDRRVVVQNNTSTAMREFYASSKGQKTWQEDILGKEMLASGGAIRVNIDDGSGYCVYDLRAVFEDGVEAIQSQVNVCEVGTFTFND